MPMLLRFGDDLERPVITDGDDVGHRGARVITQLGWGRAPAFGAGFGACRARGSTGCLGAVLSEERRLLGRAARKEALCLTASNSLKFGRCSAA